MKQDQSLRPKVRSVDFGAIWAAVKKHRKLYSIVLPATIIIAFIISLSIPPYYKCEVILAPESGGSGLGTLSSLASSFGINLGNGESSEDAITPSLYPDLMKSTDFKTALFGVKVKRKGGREMTYYDYLKNEWKEPWWEDFFGLMAPKKAKDTLVNNFELTGEQARIAGMINKNVICKIDKKTKLITIDVTAQDPYVVALVADSVKTRLQDFLTEYKTQKVRHDLAYVEKLHKQAKKDYERARKLYTEFMDSNQDLVLLTAMQKQNDLENEMQLQYNNYTTLSAQLLSAKAKVQEETPAFTTLQRATVPLGPTGPRTKNIVLLALFMAIVLTTIFVLFKENQLRSLLGIS